MTWQFQRTATHGPKKIDEKETFDQQAGTATRQTKDGGKSELKTPSCGRDALAFLFNDPMHRRRCADHDDHEHQPEYRQGRRPLV